MQSRKSLGAVVALGNVVHVRTGTPLESRSETQVMKKKVAEAMSNERVRKILSATIAKAKSVRELKQELGIPLRSLYRYIYKLRSLGLLVEERYVLRDTGGKYVLYRSTVKTVTVKYTGDILEVELTPNEDIIDRFWSSAWTDRRLSNRSSHQRSESVK